MTDAAAVERPAEILLVEDNAGDVRLIREALADRKGRANLTVVANGEDALALLRREGPHGKADRPDLILLDLNLPRKGGRELLAAIKGDERLRPIPVVILSSSQAERDILDSYDHHANCYVSKPLDLDEFIDVVRRIEEFWLTVVRLPRG
jgi:CheY-like chemotaxis protein